MSVTRVRAGERIVFRASDWNAMADAADAHRLQRMPAGADTGRELLPSGLVLVKNASGADVGRFGVLGIDSVVVSPADNLAEFQSRVALSCVAPQAGVHEGWFVILAEPLASGKIGRAWASGVCPVQIEVASESDWYADILDAETGKLGSGPTGSATILAIESGTGTKWAVVRIGQAGAAIPPGGLRYQVLAKQSDDSGDADWDYVRAV